MLQFSKLYPTSAKSFETQGKWETVMHELSVAAKENGFTEASPHLAIKSLHVRKVELKQSWSLPPRSGISYIIMPSTKYLASVDRARADDVA